VAGIVVQVMQCKVVWGVQAQYVAVLHYGHSHRLWHHIIGAGMFSGA
jgi:hypothetical protein